MQQPNNAPPQTPADWPNDFDFRLEVAEQQELIERCDSILAAEKRQRPTHRFEYDF